MDVRDRARRTARTAARLAAVAVTTVAAATKQLTRMLFPVGGLGRLVLPARLRHFKRSLGDGSHSSLVMAPVLWAARTFPQAPLELLRIADEDPKPEPDHALIKLVKRPNDFYSGIVLWMATLLSFMVDGNAYWLKIRNAAGEPIQLWWVPHWMIEPVISTDPRVFIDQYEYQPGTDVIRIDASEVVHFRFGLDGANPRKGLSPLRSVLQEIFTDEEAASFAASLLRNSGVPGLIISPDTDLTVDPNDVEATKESVRDATTGDRRGEPLVLRGKTRIEKLAWSPEQLNVRALRRVPEERVTAVLGIPAIVAGLGAGLDRSTFANMQEAFKAAWENCLIPTGNLLSDELVHQLLPDLDDAPDTVELNFSIADVRALQEDENRKAERWGALVASGVATRADARRAFELEVTAADDVYLIPLNVLERPAGVPLPPPAPAPAPELELAGRKQLSPAAAQRLVAAFDRDLIRLSDAMADDLQRAFDVLGERAADAYARLTFGLTTGASGNVNGHGVKQPDPRDAQIIDRIVRQVAVTGYTIEVVQPAFENAYARTAEQTVRTINAALDLGVNLPDQVARQIIANGGRRAGLLDIRGDLRATLFRILADAREEGLGAAATGRRIREIVPAGRYVHAGSRYRAELIARTETKFAQNFSSIRAYEATPVVTQVQAFDDRLGHGDEPCSERNGQLFSFEAAEDEMDEEHPNGTLSFAPVTREMAHELATT